MWSFSLLEVVRSRDGDEMAMNQVQDPPKKVFNSHDLVLWHTRSEQRSLPLPVVVVRQDKGDVTIRFRLEGNMK